MTSAPSSPRSRAASGPAQKLDMSITRRPPSAPEPAPWRRDFAEPRRSARKRIGGPTKSTVPFAASSTGSSNSLSRACSCASHSSRVLHFATAAGVSRSCCSHSSAVRCGKAAPELVEHAVGPLAIGELRQRLHVREVEAAVAVGIEPDEPAQLAPTLGAAEIDLHAAAVARPYTCAARGCAPHDPTPSRWCSR